MARPFGSWSWVMVAAQGGLVGLLVGCSTSDQPNGPAVDGGRQTAGEIDIEAAAPVVRPDTSFATNDAGSRGDSSMRDSDDEPPEQHWPLMDAGYDSGARDVGVAPRTVCSTSLQLGLDMPVEGVPTHDVMLGAVTPDELVIAWSTRPDEAGVGSSVFTASRSVYYAPFGPAQSVAWPVGWSAFERVALDPDGLWIIGVRADGKAFGGLRRGSRAEAFAGDPDERPFVKISAALGPSERLADPALGSDGATLVFSILGRSDGHSVWRAVVSTDGVYEPSPWLAPALDASDAGVCRPGSFSYDLKSFLYYDETRRLSVIASVGPGDELSSSHPLSLPGPAQLNASCTRAYYSDPALSGGIFVARQY